MSSAGRRARRRSGGARRRSTSSTRCCSASSAAIARPARFREYAATRGENIGDRLEADADLIAFVERLLAGSVGAASARGMVPSIAKGEPLRFDEVMAILEETQQAIAHSRELEQKSRELEATANELTRANAQLKELDRLKDDFLSTVSHELRTPLTSIRTFSEILQRSRRPRRGRPSAISRSSPARPSG